MTNGLNRGYSSISSASNITMVGQGPVPGAALFRTSLCIACADLPALSSSSSLPNRITHTLRQYFPYGTSNKALRRRQLWLRHHLRKHRN